MIKIPGTGNSSSQFSNWLWDPVSLQFSYYQWLFSVGIKPTAHHLQHVQLVLIHTSSYLTILGVTNFCDFDCLCGLINTYLYHVHLNCQCKPANLQCENPGKI